MKLIGRGWQYGVYDIGNGRVLKKCNTILNSYLVMFRDCFPYIKHPVWKFSGYHAECKKSAINSINAISKNSLDSWMFGNPKINSYYEYEQDYLTPLWVYLKSVNEYEGKKMIDQFAKFSTLLLQNSLIEKNFNMAENFGLNGAGEVVLMDLGEIYSTKKEIEKQIQKRVWSAPTILTKVPVYLREYFVVTMDELFRHYTL
jgi:hypothetical protein